MASVGIVTDSVACLPPETRSRLGIEMTGMYLVLDGHSYRDSVDLTAAEFFDRLGDTIDHKTAAPSVGDWLEAMERAVAAGAESVLVLTLPQKLSSTYDSARAAAELVSRPTVVIDSRTVAGAEGLYVRRLAEEAQAGATLEQLVERAERRRGSYSLEFALAGLERLAASGRMPSAVARIGDAADLKTVMTIDRNGGIRLAGAVRSMDRAVERLHRRVLDNFPPGVSGRVVTMHVLMADAAEELARRLRAERPELEVEVSIFSPVMGASTGPLLGVAWEDPSIAAVSPR
jgi:DegV family protein with EDD domain